MRILTEEEHKKSQKKMVAWVRKTLNKRYVGSHLYNMLLQMKQMVEGFERKEDL